MLKHGGWNKGKHQLEEQIYNCIIDFDIWFKIVLICQNSIGYLEKYHLEEHTAKKYFKHAHSETKHGKHDHNVGKNGKHANCAEK